MSEPELLPLLLVIAKALLTVVGVVCLLSVSTIASSISATSSWSCGGAASSGCPAKRPCTRA